MARKKRITKADAKKLRKYRDPMLLELEREEEKKRKGKNN